MNKIKCDVKLKLKHKEDGIAKQCALPRQPNQWLF